MACGMEAEYDLGAGRSFHTQALRADGHAAIGADFDESAHAPHVIPPRATRGGPQDGAFFFAGLLPRPVRGLPQFAMDFLGVTVRSQVVDVPVGDGHLGDLFTGEVGGEAPLPVLVGAFDFAFGLGRGGLAEAEVIELERPTELGERGGIVGEKEAVVIHVKTERAAVGQEGGGQEIEVREQEFPLVNLGAGEQAAAIIEQVEHGEGVLGVRKPAVGRGIELPEFADVGTLPAADGGLNFFGRDGVSQIVFERPAADLGAVELEGVQARGFGGDEAVGTGRGAGQTLFEEGQDGRRPGRGMIAPGSAGHPGGCLWAGAGGVVRGGQRVETAGGEAELFGGLSGTQRVLSERVEHMADKGRCVTVEELLMLFKDAQWSRRSRPHHPSFRRASLRSPSSKRGGAAWKIPVLLAPRHQTPR